MTTSPAPLSRSARLVAEGYAFAPASPDHVCPGCGVAKPLTAFAKVPRTALRRAFCWACLREAAKGSRPTPLGAS